MRGAAKFCGTAARSKVAVAVRVGLRYCQLALEGAQGVFEDDVVFLFVIGFSG